MAHTRGSFDDSYLYQNPENDRFYMAWVNKLVKWETKTSRKYVGLKVLNLDVYYSLYDQAVWKVL